jgi:hypothetical protein
MKTKPKNEKRRKTMNRQKVVVEQKEENGGTKMKTKPKNEKRRKTMSFSSGGSLMFS